MNKRCKWGRGGCACGDTVDAGGYVKPERERKSTQTGVLHASPPLQRRGRVVCGGGVVSGAGFCSINKRARPTRECKGEEDVGCDWRHEGIRVYAGREDEKNTTRVAPAYAAMTGLLGRGDVLMAFAGAISDTGTVCHPVTSGDSTDRLCMSEGAGSEPRRTK